MGWEVQNLLGCHSKHDLMGSSAKTGNIFIQGVIGAKNMYFLGSKT